jgi:acyl-CoA thioester hydrolase
MMIEPTAGEFQDGAHWLPIRVYYEDTDFTGVVYHANYLRYMERGRSDFIRLAGVDHVFMAAQGGAAFAIAKFDIDYKKPARIDDALVVRSQFFPVKGVRLQAFQQILRDGELLAEARVTAVCVGPDARPIKPPKAMIERLAPWFAPE